MLVVDHAEVKDSDQQVSNIRNDSSKNRIVLITHDEKSVKMDLLFV